MSKTPLRVRMRQFYEPVEGCWLWSGCIDKATGYGQIRGESGRTRNAHRALYEELVGPVPPGLQLDHLCRVRHCVNPSHLEPVTNAENARRGRIARYGDVGRACPRGPGHKPSSVNGDCKACAAARTARYREKTKLGLVPVTVITCDDCGESAANCARGLCRKCYTRWYRLQKKVRDEAKAESA